jgi:hypothetical protein
MFSSFIRTVGFIKLDGYSGNKHKCEFYFLLIVIIVVDCNLFHVN